ncbi:MAG: sulfide/dihydroorotate dehydrogenase-like FAD/NAD-binding protein [Clostridium sp.]
MLREALDCIDAGTEFCPCHLAEAGECILCSQLHGQCFCDCKNWKGVCIYQDFYNNGNKAKEGRQTYNCNVVDTTLFQNDVLMIKFNVPHKLAIDLVRPGSYIFIRTCENNYFYDVPISIMESDTDKDEITIVIEIRGIKTKRLLEIKKDDDIVIRGPYWNGVFGQKDINKTRNSKCLVLSRGIGLAPMMPVIKKLHQNGNDISVYSDRGGFKLDFSIPYLWKYNLASTEMNLLGKGDLSDECKALIKNKVENEGVTFIHLAGADILTYSVIEYLDEINRSDVLLSCCNNFKMCCGEGICGACTARFSGHRVKRFCKTQSDPRNIFEGRRFI